MNKIAVCSWPDGQSRDVVVIKDDGESAKIIWNGKVDKVVIGFDEVVPSEWLNYVKQYAAGCPSAGCADCANCTDYTCIDKTE